IAIDHFCKQQGLQTSEVCYVFDDVLDISIAAVCGLRVLIRRKANPLFNDYLIRNHYVDYITAEMSGGFAVRETSEVLMGLNQNFDACMNERKDFTSVYQDYLGKRQSIPVHFFTTQLDKIVEHNQH
ncbi:MAG: phosphatase, partial [Bacteroidia bacterium]|nr:phosphatase [Bacteroidia bacterium]